MRSIVTVTGRPIGFLPIFFIILSPAAAQEAKPAAIPIHKITISNAGVPTVRYYTTSESPRLQALCRTLQWAENEVTIVEQLQLLKLEQVGYERLRLGQRSANLLNPGLRPFWRGPFPCNYGDDLGDTALNYSLAGILAREATPESAMQMIRLLEKAQTDLADELKKAPAKERVDLESDAKVLEKAIGILRAKEKKSAPSPSNRVASSDSRPAVGKQAFSSPVNPSSLIVKQSPPPRPSFSSPLAPPAPKKPPAPDPDRLAVDQELRLFEQARDAYNKERDECNRLLQTSSSDKEAIVKRHEVAKASYQAAMDHWVESQNKRFAALQERRTVLKPPTPSAIKPIPLSDYRRSTTPQHHN